METTAHPHILNLLAYEPGKPVEELAREMGLNPSDMIKLASNENPLGPSPLALQAMRDTLERSHFYPDGGAWALRNAIAEKLGLDAQTFFDISSKASGQSWSMTSYCPLPGVGPTTPADNGYQGGFATALMLKDLKLAVAAAAGAGATPAGGEDKVEAGNQQHK